MKNGWLRKGFSVLVVLIISCFICATIMETMALADNYYPGPDPVTNKPVVTPRPKPRKPKEQYTLTIYYKYQDGSQAARTFHEEIPVGDTYNVVSPKIPKYTATKLKIKGVMPKRNLVYTVYYYTGGTIIIEDYETPLGLGDTIINIGDCFE